MYIITLNSQNVKLFPAIILQYQRVNCGVKSLRNTVTRQQKFRYTLIFSTRCEFTNTQIY